MTKKNKLKTKNFYLKTQKLVNDEFKKEAKRIREETENYEKHIKEKEQINIQVVLFIVLI